MHASGSKSDSCFFLIYCQRRILPWERKCQKFGGPFSNSRKFSELDSDLKITNSLFFCMQVRYLLIWYINDDRYYHLSSFTYTYKHMQSLSYCPFMVLHTFDLAQCNLHWAKSKVSCHMNLQHAGVQFHLEYSFLHAYLIRV